MLVCLPGVAHHVLASRQWIFESTCSIGGPNQLGGQCENISWDPRALGKRGLHLPHSRNPLVGTTKNPRRSHTRGVWQFFDLRLLIVLAVPQPSELSNGDLVSFQVNGVANGTCFSTLFVNNFHNLLIVQSHIRVDARIAITHEHKLRKTLSGFPSTLIAV